MFPLDIKSNVKQESLWERHLHGIQSLQSIKDQTSKDMGATPFILPLAKDWRSWEEMGNGL